jgi:hypothetical protein
MEIYAHAVDSKKGAAQSKIIQMILPDKRQEEVVAR